MRFAAELTSHSREVPRQYGFPRSKSGVAAAALILLMGSALIRLIDLSGLPHFDELYTLLAARGWLVDGVPRIAEGLYDRALAYTVLVAGFFDAFGESLVVARMPSVIAGSLLVVAVFLWTRSVAGSLAAWIAALFVALAPISIQVSQFARFYALQGLVFWLAATGVYYLWDRRPDLWRAIPLAIACGLGFLFALHLQVLSAIGLIGVLLWLTLAIGVPLLLPLCSRPLALWGTIAALVILAAAVLAFAIVSDLLEELIRRYRFTPLHALAVRNQVWFYHLALIERYPSLWPLFPITALLAIAGRPRPALFCLSVFVPGFLLLSFGGMKQFTYLAFLMPFLFVVWAIALAQVFGYLHRGMIVVTGAALRTLDPTLDRPSLRWTMIGACLVFLVLANGAPARTLLLPFGIQLNAEAASVDWAAAREALQPWVDNASIVLTSQELHALYYFGRYDIAVSGSRISEIEGGHEFSRDNRTGRPVVSRPESIELIMACYPDGVLLTPTFNWRDPTQINSQVADLIERYGKPIDVPRGSRIVAFTWGQTDIVVPPDACAPLSQLRAPE